MTNETLPLLRKAAEWRLLSLLFERPKQGWYDEIAGLARETEAHGARSTKSLRRAASLAQDAHEEPYIALFGPGGFASPREVAYAGMQDPGHLLSSLMLFYNSFAYEPSSEDPSDHFAVETGFVGYLYLKEAYALLAGNGEGAQVANDAREQFIASHYARLVRGIAEKKDAFPQYLQEALNVALEHVKHISAETVPAAEFDPLATGCPMVQNDDERDFRF